MNIPTRIIKPPTTIERVGKGGRGLVILVTDAGKFTVPQCARAVGLSSNTLHARLRKIGWDNPNIFRKVLPKETRGVDTYICDIPDDQQGIFAHLSGKTRDRNIYKLPEPTAWDNRCCRRGI